MALKIFKVERTDIVDWDEYDSFIVIAKDKDDALSFHPRGKRMADDARWGSWVTSAAFDSLVITEIGQANEGEEPRVVLASFNAG